MSPILEVKDLSAGYDDQFRLSHITAAIGRGEMTAVLGPNGSGKTTFLRAISRVLRPQAGEVLFEGKNIWRMKPGDLARALAFVSQTVDPDLRITVGEFVLLGRIPHHGRFQFLETRRDEAVAEEALSLTGVRHLRDRFLHELSGGERQLAAISRALAQEPRLLLLDEPTAHLDVSHQFRVLELVGRLNRKKGLTVIAVLHDLNLASAYCEKLLVFSQGALYASGRLRETLTREMIQDVYQTTAIIGENPLSHKPHVFLAAPQNPVE